MKLLSAATKVSGSAGTTTGPSRPLSERKVGCSEGMLRRRRRRSAQECFSWSSGRRSCRRLRRHRRFQLGSNPEALSAASYTTGILSGQNKSSDAGGKVGSFLPPKEENNEEEEGGRMSGRQVIMQTLKSTLASNKLGIARTVLALVVVTTVILAQPLLSGTFFQTLVAPNPDTRGLKRVLVAMLVTYMMEPICTMVYVSTVSKVAQKFVSEMQQKIFAMILAQNTAFFDLNSSTSLLSIVSTEINSINDVLGGNLSRDRGFRAIFEATGGVVVLGLIAPQLAPVLLVFIFLTSYNAARYSRKTKGLFGQREMFKLKMSTTANTAISNIKTVRAFSAERFEYANFLNQLKKSDFIGLQLGKSKASLESLSRFAIYSSLIMLYTYGGLLVVNGAMPVRSLIAGIGYTFSLVFATQGITNTFADLSRALVSFKRIEAFIDDLEPISTASETEIIEGLKLQSESCEEESYEDVLPPVVDNGNENQLNLLVDSFSYPTRPDATALKNVNIELKSRKITALVGPSGAGKSSIVQLLCRFYKLADGQMQYNGIDASRFSRREWSKNVSLVGQEPVLFPGTIKDNIGYALEDPTMSQIKEAAMAANAHEFISKLPDGYDTDVGERGGRLSGGQRQRIAIARAFIRDAPILLLDEATASLDAESERLVQDALEKLFGDKAVLVIAHRLSTVVNADEIVVVEEGQIVDRGTHQDLLKRCDLYKKLIGAQQIKM